jgi:hypothetical protein
VEVVIKLYTARESLSGQAHDLGAFDLDSTGGQGSSRRLLARAPAAGLTSRRVNQKAEIS